MFNTTKKVQIFSRQLKLLCRFRHKQKQSTEKGNEKVSPEIVTFLENLPDYKSIKDNIPKTLLRKYKTPESMYLINEKSAKEIAHTLRSHIAAENPIIEVNPGFGFLSKQLLNIYKNNIHMYEVSHNFSCYIEDLQKKCPRITYKISDFFGMWKLAFQDKMDNGTRIKDLLGDLATEDHGRVVKIVGAMPSLSFVKHLLNTLIFHNSASQLGRPDLFITMPGHHFDFLVDNQIQNTKHRSLPALFQMMFDYKILSKIPKVHFLPWMQPPESKWNNVMNDNYMYLVNITQKETLPCAAEDLPLLWYFFRPHMISKSTRVIPMLEQWIPGCGVWLITGQDPPETARSRAPDAADAALPHMNIFTEFGDLNLQQKITVFKRFISWPEFEQCQFRVTMENNLPKFISAIDTDDKDTIASMPEDMDTSDSEHEEL